MDRVHDGGGVEPNDTDIEPESENNHPAGRMCLRFASIAARVSVLAGTGLAISAMTASPITTFPVSLQ